VDKMKTLWFPLPFIPLSCEEIQLYQGWGFVSSVF